MRDRVVRSAQIVVDRHVAGRHVGQILQQPQRRKLRHAFGGPAIVVEGPFRIAAAIDAGAELFGHRQHVIGAENAAGAFGIVRAAADDQAGVGKGQLSGGDAHLALAAHDFQPLADGLFLFFFQRAEVFDIAGEIADFGRHVGRQKAWTESPPTGRRRFCRRKAPPTAHSWCCPRG